MKTYLSWSTGKDSALALFYLLKQKEYNVELLLTTINKKYNRVSMHGIRKSLLEKQIESIQIPCEIVELPEELTHEEYSQIMEQKTKELYAKGFECAAFGDIFLEDIRKYREEQLSSLRIKPVFPLWQKDTSYLIQQIIDLGIKAVVVSVNASKLDQSFLGRVIDKEFIKDLPKNVDPCGENGEYHTFCFEAPFFKNPIDYSIGEIVFRKYTHDETEIGFWFCDILEK